ncbi:MAG TPA: hypothetical protein VFP93_01940 [Gammaproteobacteria bacterium]|nr:hypothetical protein [Gammaproteobacteria bacterium]
MHKKPTPFWKETHRFFLYPFQISMVLIWGRLSIIPLWLAQIEERIPFWILLSTAIFIYSLFLFAILDNALSGKFTPPKLSQKFTGNGIWLILQQPLFISLLIIIYYFSEENLGAEFAYMVTAVVTFCLPAMLTIFSATRQLLHAINPIKITEYILKTHSTYFILLGIIYLLEAGTILSYELLNLQLPSVMILHFTAFLTVYISIVIFQLIGYAAYLNHEKLELSVINIEPVEAKKNHPHLLQSQQLIRSGALLEAKKVLHEALQREPLNCDLNDQYHKLMLLMEDKEELQSHGNRYLMFLIRKDYKTKAMQIYLNIYHMNPDYKMNDMELVIKMAILLDQSKKKLPLIHLLRNLHIIYPKHPLVPKAYGFLAKLLFEEFGQEKEAKDILEYVLYNFPNHPIHTAIKKQLNIIENFKQKT